MIIENYCIVCGNPIYESMGISLAGDVLEFIQGKRNDIRQICERDEITKLERKIDSEDL